LCLACVLHPRRPVAVPELGSLDLMCSTAASLPLMLLLASCIELSPQPPPALVLDGIPIYGRAPSLPSVVAVIINAIAQAICTSWT
jgi:hypothetical protein